MLSHQVPGGDRGEVIEKALDIALAVLDKRRRGSDRPRKTTKPSKNAKYVPIAVQRAVDDKDGGSCAYVSPGGKRCGSTYQLQYHHIVPSSKNGPATVDNISLRCRVDNVRHAEKDFGRETMDRYRKRRPEPVAAARADERDEDEDGERDGS